MCLALSTSALLIVHIPNCWCVEQCARIGTSRCLPLAACPAMPPVAPSFASAESNTFLVGAARAARALSCAVPSGPYRPQLPKSTAVAPGRGFPSFMVPLGQVNGQDTRARVTVENCGVHTHTHRHINRNIHSRQAWAHTHTAHCPSPPPSPKATKQQGTTCFELAGVCAGPGQALV